MVVEFVAGVAEASGVTGAEVGAGAAFVVASGVGAGGVAAGELVEVSGGTVAPLLEGTIGLEIGAGGLAE